MEAKHRKPLLPKELELQQKGLKLDIKGDVLERIPGAYCQAGYGIFQQRMFLTGV